MKKLRPLLTALIALVFYTITDILVWQRVFEANGLVKYAEAYHTGWTVSLAGYAVIGVITMADRWKDCLFYLAVLLMGAYSGLEDVMYYVLDGRSMPQVLPWLGGNPMIFNISRAGVLMSVAFWFLSLGILYTVLFLPERAVARTSQRGSARKSSRVSAGNHLRAGVQAGLDSAIDR